MPDPCSGDAPSHTSIHHAMSRLVVPLFLREADVKSLLTMEMTLAALDAAFREWAAGRVENQPRRRVSGGAVLATMSASLPAKGLMGFKAYSHGKAGARFWVCLFDAASGQPRAVMEADWLGRMRTGAVSGLATRHLARPEASVLTVIGTGTQALTQVLAVAAVRALREVRVVSRDPTHRDAFVATLKGALPGTIGIHPAGGMRDAVEGADVLTTITSAARPLFPGEWLRAGQHLNVCGSNYPDRREIDGRVVARADLVVADDADAARLEAGDLLLAEREGQLNWERVHSLRAVVAGATGNRQASDVTLFKSVGLAIEDVAAGAAVLELAQSRGVGRPRPDDV
jgi:ornithine cyclodeaminase/alanine dehydrogenase-like protein (mu-crystallin family)